VIVSNEMAPVKQRWKVKSFDSPKDLQGGNKSFKKSYGSYCYHRFMRKLLKVQLLFFDLSSLFICLYKEARSSFIWRSVKDFELSGRIMWSRTGHDPKISCQWKENSK